MSIHLADAELPEPMGVRAAPSSVQPASDILEIEEHERLTVARGIIGGMIISIPIWALISFTVYLLLWP